MGITKRERKKRVRRRIRKTLRGTSAKPRLLVFRSNKEIYAQIVDDVKGVTMISASSREKSFTPEGNKVKIAFEVGKVVADRALGFGIKSVSFDRGGSLYHGRVKSLAEGARQSGLNF